MNGWYLFVEQKVNKPRLRQKNQGPEKVAFAEVNFVCKL
jgi:hypothetical protein